MNSAAAASQPTRQRILQAALSVFANQGYAGSSVVDIARAARVPKPALYYYFASKEDLFQALVDQALDDRLELLQGVLEPGLPLREQLVRIVNALLEHTRKHRDLMRLAFSIHMAAPRELPAGLRHVPKTQRVFRLIGAIMQTAIEAGELDSRFTAQELAAAFYSQVVFSLATLALPTRSHFAAANPDRLVDLFLRGAAAHETKRPAVRTTRPRASLRAVSLLIASALLLTSLAARAQDRVAEAAKGNAGNAKPTNAPIQPTAPSTTPAERTRPATPVIAPPPSTATNSALPPTDTRDAGDTPGIPPSNATPGPPRVAPANPSAGVESPLRRIAAGPGALTLSECFRLAAIRSDTLKISVQDIRIAQARLSQAFAGLFPTIRVANRQNFFNESGSGFTNNGGVTGVDQTSIVNPTTAVTNGGAAAANGSTSTAATGSTATSSNAASASGAATSVGTGNAVSTDTSSLGSLSSFAATGGRSYSSSNELTLAYPLFNGLKNYNLVGAGKADVQAKRFDLQRDYQTLYQDVADAFYQILINEGELVVLHDLDAALAARVDDLRARVEIGRSRPAELLQSRADLATNRVTIEEIRGALLVAKEMMAYYVGIPSERISLREAMRFPSPSALEAYLAQINARPDVLAQVQRDRQARRNLSASKGDLYPAVNTTGFYQVTSDPPTTAEWQVNFSIEMPVFDGGLILSRINEQRAIVRQTEINIEQLQRQASEDIRIAYVNFEASVAQIVHLREAVDLSAQNTEAQLGDYQKGVVSNLDVLTALQQLQTSRRNLHTADMNGRLNLIKLQVAAGDVARDIPDVRADNATIVRRALPVTK